LKQFFTVFLLFVEIICVANKIYNHLFEGEKKDEKMKKLIVFFLAVLVLLTFSACTTFQLSGLASMGSKTDYQVLGTFETSQTAHKLLGSSGGKTLFNFTQDATDTTVNKIVKSEIAKFGGDAVINISVVQKATFLNSFLNGLTGNIWAPTKITVSGTVIRYN
jgi:hypothetical protein